jgi:hypothetical protein
MLNCGFALQGKLKERFGHFDRIPPTHHTRVIMPDAAPVAQFSLAGVDVGPACKILILAAVTGELENATPEQAPSGRLRSGVSPWRRPPLPHDVAKAASWSYLPCLRPIAHGARSATLEIKELGSPADFKARGSVVG